MNTPWDAVQSLEFECPSCPQDVHDLRMKNNEIVMVSSFARMLLEGSLHFRGFVFGRHGVVYEILFINECDTEEGVPVMPRRRKVGERKEIYGIIGTRWRTRRM